jgi:tetratricopeptide (TPR) repeat protein
VREFALARLEEANVGVLVSDMLATERPPEPLVKALTSRCRGNPFFVAEYLRAAVAEGLLTRSHGRWQVANDGDFAIPLPDTLGELVLRRLGGLGAVTREVLEGAAVLGKGCVPGLLERLVQVHGEAWNDALNELQRAQVVEEDEEGRFQLLHDKLREVTYAAIPAGRRAALHLRAGELLEAEGGADPHLLASHFRAGQSHARAIRYLEAAAQAAMQTFSNREVLRCYEEVIELDAQEAREAPATWEESLAQGIDEFREETPQSAPPVSGVFRLAKPNGAESRMRSAAALRRARWYRRMSEAAFFLGDLSACLQHATTALELLGFKPPQTPGGWTLALLRDFSVQLRHRLRAGARPPQSALDRAVFAEASLLMQRLSERFYYNFDALPMIAASLAAVNLGERAATEVQIAKPYGMLGMTVALSKLHRLGHRYFELGHEVAHQTNDQEGLTFCLYAKAAWLVGDGRWEEVRALCTEAIRIAEARGAKQDLSTAKTLIAQADFYNGHFERSRDLFLEIGEDARRRGNDQHHAWGLYAAARALIPLGELERARLLLREAHQLLEPQVDVPSKIITPGLLAVAAHRLGDDMEALEMAALCTSRIRQNLPTVFATVAGYAGVAEVYLARWERLRARGDAGAKEAEKIARRAVFDLLTLAFNIPIGWPYYHRIKGVELRLLGQPEKAAAACRKGAASARELAMPHDEALNLLELARSLPRNNPERARSLDEAERLFEDLRCPLDQQAAQAAR